MIEPRWNGSSDAAASLAERYDEIAASAERIEPYFDRTFRTRIVKLEDETLSFTSLDDDFHEMRIVLRVLRNGRIVEAAGRMNRHPYDTCPRAVESLAALVGLSVYGPKSSARIPIPRSEGCLHLADMVAIAFRSFRIAAGHEIPHEGETGRRELLTLMPRLRDTCVSFAAES